jgi:heterodisulfide reductase subunit C
MARAIKVVIELFDDEPYESDENKCVRCATLVSAPPGDEELAAMNNKTFIWQALTDLADDIQSKSGPLWDRKDVPDEWTETYDEVQW